MSAPAPRLAFLDFDGTLVSSNVVHQYLWYARHSPSVWARAGRLTRAAVLAPVWKLCDLHSRLLFNRVFYREYRGLGQGWLSECADRLSVALFQCRLYPGAKPLLDTLAHDGFTRVLVTGSLEVSVRALARDLGFDAILANHLEYRDGVATGRLLDPILAGDAKARAIQGLCSRYGARPEDCRAYSDDCADLPMLEAVGHPTAANPSDELRRLATERGWPIIDLRRTP